MITGNRLANLQAPAFMSAFDTGAYLSNRSIITGLSPGGETEQGERPKTPKSGLVLAF
jgi:hypothetical protein